MPSKNIPVNGWPQIKELDIAAPILAELDKIEAWQKSVKQETKSGAEVTYTNALALAAVSLSAEIEAEQDLHGYDHPWVGGSGKNKFNGAYNYHSASDYSPVLPETQYTISSKSTGERHINFHYIFSDDSYGENTLIVNIGETSGSATVTTPSNVKGIEIFVNGDATNTGNYAYDTQIELGATATSYAPYSNICPISGRTSVTITDYDSESNTATVTVAFEDEHGDPVTVYGGTLNVTTGVLTIDEIRPTFSGAEGESWSISNHRFAVTLPSASVDTPSALTCLSNKYAPKTASDLWSNRSTANYVGIATQGANAYVVDNVHYTNYDDTDLAAFKTALSTNKLQIAYKLATPITIQLTPTQLTMLKGYNRLSADTGNIEVTAYTGNKWN